MTRRVLRALAFLLLALVLVPAAASAQETAPARPKDLSIDEQFLVAWRSRDESRMDAIAAESVRDFWVDPYYIVRTYLFEHAEATLADPPRPSDALEAARALAARAGRTQRNAELPALVEAWARLDDAGKRDELEVQRAWARFERGAIPDGWKDTPDRRAEHLRLGPIADAHPRSMAAAILRAVLAGWHGDVDGPTVEVERDFVAAAEAAAKLPWPRGHGRSLWSAGGVAWRRGDIAAARTYWERTAAAFEEAGDRTLLSHSLRDIAESYEAMGDYATALAHAERSLRIVEELNDTYVVGLAMITVGRIQGELGQEARSLSQLERAVLQLEVISPDQLGLSYAYVEHAKACARLGLAARAVASANVGVRKIDELTPRSRFARSSAEVRTAACEALVAVGRPDEAAAFIEQARATLEKAGDLPAASDALARLGELRAQQGQLDAAVDAFERVLAETESMGSRGRAARTRAALGRVLARRGPGDTERAAALCRTAHEELTAFGDRAGAARALLDLAGLERARRRPAEAVALARRAVETQLAIGIGLGEDEAAGLRREARAAADQGMLAAADLLAASPRADSAVVADAFWFAESSRGLLLAEGIANREALLAAAVPDDVRRADTEARGRVAVLRDRLSELAAKAGTTDAELAAARAELDLAYAGLEGAVARVQREARRVADVVYPHPVSLADAQASLDAETALVLYHFAGSRALALVLTRDSARLADLGDADALRAAVQAYVDLVSVDGCDDVRKAAALYDALLRPLETETATRRRIVVSPDGPLTFLPFDALVRRDGAASARVVERWETACAPSATVRALLGAPGARGAARGRGLVALGDPVYPREGAAGADAGASAPWRRLPGTAAEVRALAGLLPPGESTLLLRDAATAAELTSALSRAPGRLAAVHIACHGRVDAERPRLTGLVLAGGATLSVDDVYRMRIPADLVVLSSCDSGQGRILHGEGATGLARAFFFAGASRVVASNWAVSDEGTRALMTSFYGRMLKDGVPAGTALREAKLAMLRAGGPAAHPAHWAAFTLWGE